MRIAGSVYIRTVFALRLLQVVPHPPALSLTTSFSEFSEFANQPTKSSTSHVLHNCTNLSPSPGKLVWSALAWQGIDPLPTQRANRDVLIQHGSPCGSWRWGSCLSRWRRIRQGTESRARPTTQLPLPRNARGRKPSDLLAWPMRCLHSDKWQVTVAEEGRLP
jgi:hypothetical protein